MKKTYIVGAVSSSSICYKVGIATTRRGAEMLVRRWAREQGQRGFIKWTSRTSDGSMPIEGNMVVDGLRLSR